MSVYPTTYAREQAGINKAKAETSGLNLPEGNLYDPTSGKGGADAGTAAGYHKMEYGPDAKPRSVGITQVADDLREARSQSRGLKTGGGSSMGIIKNNPQANIEMQDLDFGKLVRTGKTALRRSTQYKFKSDKRSVPVYKGINYDFEYQGPKDVRGSNLREGQGAGNVREGAGAALNFTPGQSTTGQGYSVQDTPINQQAPGGTRANMTGAASVGMSGMAADTPINQQLEEAAKGQ